MRLLGKSLLSQWTPYDLVTIVFLSYSAFAAIKFINFFQSVLSIILIGIIYLAIARLSLIQPISRFIIGEPTILIKHGKIIEENLRRSHYSLAELLSSIRAAGNPDIKDIDYALLEPNGQISVIKSQDVTPVSSKDLNIKTDYKGLPISVIVEGRIQYRNLRLINKNKEWLMKELEAKGYHQIQHIFYAYVNDHTHSLTVDTVKQKL